MYGNAPFGDDGSDADADADLSPAQRRQLERDLSAVAEQTRALLPGDFAVGSDLAVGARGLEATVMVRPPVGSTVSAGYTPEDDEADLTIDEDQRTDLAQGLAASAALQVKQALAGHDEPAAR